MIEGGVVRWSVAQIYSKRRDKIVDELEEMKRGTFRPMHIKRWLASGEPTSKQVDLFPTYLFFAVNDEAWGPVSQIEGVLRVMNQGRPVAVSDIKRLESDIINQVWDDPEIVTVKVPEERRSSRKPRLSKRIERRAARAAAWKAAG